MRNGCNEKVLKALGVDNDNILKLITSDNSEDFILGIELCAKYSNYALIKIYCLGHTAYICEEHEQYWDENKQDYWKNENLFNSYEQRIS